MTISSFVGDEWLKNFFTIKNSKFKLTEFRVFKL